MPVVGSFARIEVANHAAVCRRLDALEGVSTFDLGSREKIGLLIETDDLDTAHALVSREIGAVEGVLGVWPVSLHLDDEDEHEQESD